MAHVKNSILNKSAGDFQKKFGFNFICVLVFFQKYTMTSVPKIQKSVLIFIISQLVDTLFIIKLICLAENFKALA